MTQGTVTPTHMVVVQENAHSGKKFQPDDIQKLAYKLTHMYYNWPGTVRVPAPCQVDNVLKLDFIQSKMPPYLHKKYSISRVFSSSI